MPETNQIAAEASGPWVVEDGPPNLATRIEEALRRELRKRHMEPLGSGEDGHRGIDYDLRLTPRRAKRLVVVAGNGLTRGAADLSALRLPDSGAQEGPRSWEAWARHACVQAGLPQSCRYLQMRGYDLAAILQQALAIPKDENNTSALIAIWQSLAVYLRTVEPSPVHNVLAAIADGIVTTNYDDLFERRLLPIPDPQNKQQRPVQCKASKTRWPVDMLDDEIAPDLVAKYPQHSVYHLHGMLPSTVRYDTMINGNTTRVQTKEALPLTERGAEVWISALETRPESGLLAGALGPVGLARVVSGQMVKRLPMIRSSDGSRAATS